MSSAGATAHSKSCPNHGASPIAWQTMRPMDDPLTLLLMNRESWNCSLQEGVLALTRRDA